MRLRARSSFIAAAAAASCATLPVATCFGDGIYEPVELRGKEPHDLIETAHHYHDQFMRRSVLHGDERLLELVRRIGHDLAPEPTDDYFDYEFYVVRDPSPNAFAMPNGRIYVHTGMIARLDDSSQLAALLGHEITHVAGHHSIIQFRIKAGQILDGIFTGGLITLFTQLQYSRELEQESDDRATQLVLDSPYDPHAAPELMDLLAEDFEGLRPRISTVWTTHPDPEKRAETSRAIVADMPVRERDTQAFDAIVHPLRALTIRDYIRDDYAYTAIALGQTMLEKYPEDIEFRMLLGDAWKALGPRSEFAPEDFSNADKRRNLRQRVFRTRSERSERLLETEEGRAAFATNLSHARGIYEEILRLDPTYAAAHRGLGEVHEALNSPREAAREYLQYVRQSPDATDRAVIIARLTALRDALAREETTNDTD
jgi:predicted Zn-dependent protease